MEYNMNLRRRRIKIQIEKNNCITSTKQKQLKLSLQDLKVMETKSRVLRNMEPYQFAEPEFKNIIRQRLTPQQLMTTY